jgi:hypothetical protein
MNIIYNIFVRALDRIQLLRGESSGAIKLSSAHYRSRRHILYSKIQRDANYKTHLLDFISQVYGLKVISIAEAKR